MANFSELYDGDVTLKASQIVIGPIKNLATGVTSWEIEIVSGGGSVGSYVYEVADTDDDASWSTIDTKSGAGLYSETNPAAFHRIRLVSKPAPGTVVRVTLSGSSGEEGIPGPAGTGGTGAGGGSFTHAFLFGG